MADLDKATIARRDAALAQLRRYGDPALRSVARPVEHFDGALEDEVRRMTGLLEDALGAGLAATQLAVMHRVFVFRAQPDAPVRAFVNPVLEWTGEERETDEEGCLSIPDVWIEVERALRVRMRGFDARGRELTVEAEGLEARVLQHELDHLDGVLMLDRAAADQRRAALRAMRVI
ncbi:MAG TPA: peptide deformylase [Solirubrobacteraceae bacterium]|nr:peptide deformylase [Solirubrobacteraceae bacterium]